ncbi:[lysine-biosynthesis-protein LysW]--L-2-aminoadipate ligase [Halarchaeum solikamskense]|uniref:lysine biosynthesis protein LysX n=1 Tax=Halarchaeum nitratireducens TaxID=489913 RepID=UPI001B3B147E|nr:lysine biosynthesis protein LysX [Halarchaeum solikamskense]MBP2250407.1 [lysine-biosynthesis-protein LysW]--L-2-aminoadipate ligase [Halarchaeum solikamskense]
MRLGFCYSRIRKDETLLLETLRERGHDVAKIDVREPRFAIGDRPDEFDDLDLVLNRCQESSRVRYVSRFCEHYDLPVVNGSEPTSTCADKVRGSIALADAGVPTPRTEVAFDVESALDVIEAFGYPCVLKPVTGSWGRLMAKIDTRDAAEAILEHKQTLGSYEHSVFYVQEFVPKPDRDIRVVAADGEPIAAMTRSSEHWITNAARGGEATAFAIDDEIAALVERASDAVGGGLLGVDLMETGDGYTVHEVNATCEFKALNDAVPEVDVPARIVEWLETKPGVSAA